MLQLRAQGSGDQRWFNPERDMLYGLPRVMRRALVKFEELYPDNLTKAAMEAQKLARLMSEILAGSLDKEKTLERVTALDAEFSSKLGRAFFLCVLLEMNEWVKDVKMKDKPSPLTVDDLNKLADEIGRAHV